MRSTWKRLLFAALIPCLYPWPSVRQVDFSVPVVSVLDADTREVLHKQYPERIRSAGGEEKLVA